MEELMFTCAECGKVFPPDPNCMLEVEMALVAVPEDMAEQIEESTVPEDFLKEASTDMLKEIGLTPESRDKLLNGENVTAGGACVCLQCQDDMMKEPDFVERL